MTTSGGGGHRVRGLGVSATIAAMATVLALTVPATAAPLPQNWEAGPSLPAGFTPRWDFAYAEFPPTGRIVLFGGAPAQLGQPWYNDTWIYDDASNAWSQGPTAPPGLVPRGGAAMAYDPVSHRIVLFGGAGPGWPPLRDTWLFDGNQWTPGPPTPSTMAARTGAQMVFDPDIGKVVLFGGSGAKAYGETWAYDGAINRWKRLFPAATPPARVAFGMAYDPTLHRLVMAGGDMGSDVWLFDGWNWTPGPSMTASMGNLERVRMQYHPNMGGVVLFGGLGPASANNNVYLLKGGAWSSITTNPTPRPTARIDPAMVWDPVKQRMMVFGGVIDGSNGTQALSDSWFFDAPAGVALSPSVGPVGTVAAVASSSGWSPGSTVHVNFMTTWVKDVTADANGAVSTTVSIPQRSPGSYTISLVSDAPNLKVSADFAIPSGGAGPAVASASAPASVSPAIAPVGPAAPSSPAVRYRATPAVASGPITAHDGRFWLGSSPVLLHGIDAAPIQNADLTDDDYALMAAWHMNVIRMRTFWSQLEPDPPVHNANGTWTHTYNTASVALLRQQIQMAANHGIYSLVENYCGPPCFGNGWPDWLYQSAYNSAHVTYNLGDSNPGSVTSTIAAQNNYYSDALQKQFTRDLLVFLAAQLKGTPGLLGYEMLNEPSQGTMPDGAATTATMLGASLYLAQGVRPVDPNAILFFMTRGSSGEGICNAGSVLSQFQALGNVALDVHDYFGGRWGGGLNLNPGNPNYCEAMGDLYDFVLSPQMPPYLGTALAHAHLADTFNAALAPYGIPLFVGELGGRGEAEPANVALFATTTAGLNMRRVSWAAQTYNGANSVFKSDGSPEPWVPVLAAAAAFH